MVELKTATAPSTTPRCSATTVRCRINSGGVVRRGFCIAPTAATPVLARSSSHGRQQINAVANGQNQNGTSVQGGDGYCLSSLLNGVRQWHVLNLNCAVLMSCATTSKPLTRRNTRAMSCCRCWLMRPGTTPNTGGMSSLCSTSSRPCGTNAVTWIASAKTTLAALNSTGGGHQRIRLQPR